MAMLFSAILFLSSSDSPYDCFFSLCPRRSEVPAVVLPALPALSIACFMLEESKFSRVSNFHCVFLLNLDHNVWVSNFRCIFLLNTRLQYLENILFNFSTK